MPDGIPAFGGARTFTKNSGRLSDERESEKYFPDSAAAARKCMFFSKTGSKNWRNMPQLSSIQLSMPP